MNQDNENTPRAIFFSLLLVAGCALGNDSVLPFYSVTFGLGAAIAYFLAVNGGPVGALMVSSSVLLAMVLQAISRGGAVLDETLYQIPALLIFFVSFSVLPMLLPWILMEEEKLIQEESLLLEKKLIEFDTTIQEERKDKIEDKGSQEREALVKITSRTTQLSGFLRDILQASSPKEISQLLFTNVTKAFGGKEVALLTILDSGDEVLITKAAHPEYGTLEGKRISLEEQSFLQQAIDRGAPVLLPDRIVYQQPDLGVRLVIPLRVQDRCESLITLGRTRQEKDLTGEDAHFLGSLAELAGHAIEQLLVVLDT
jgi:hypothetical protein